MESKRQRDKEDKQTPCSGDLNRPSLIAHSIMAMEPKVTVYLTPKCARPSWNLLKIEQNANILISFINFI